MKRYSLVEKYIGVGEFVGDSKEDPEGEYVLYADAQAEVDAVMEKAVQFATATISDIVAEGTVKQAEAFLASATVREWQARQKEAT